EAVGVHICTQQNSRSLNPYDFVACLVGQLHAQLPGFAQAVEAKRPEERRKTATDAFRELIVEPARGLEAPDGARLIVVDSLDEGNFLYARLALDALEDGTLPVGDLGRLAPGLTSFYDTLFKRRFPDIEAYDRDYAALFRALAVARGPLPFKLLQRICGVSAEVLHRRLLRVQAYLRVFGQGEAASYALFHKSLQDWLTDPDAAGDYWCRAATGHAEIAEVLRADGWGDYALRYLPAHLLGSEQVDRAAGLLCDWEFLEAKAEAGLVFELAGDFAAVGAVLPLGDDRGRLLGLLEEAVRRDIHFLARHPTTLFQCLWNSGWWYDCPEAARHYELPAERSGKGSLPWEREGSKLSVLLQRWRAEKERARPGFVWLRSLRPPALPLGTGQKMVLSGHTNTVTSVVFSADGKRIVSGSWD